MKYTTDWFSLFKVCIDIIHISITYSILPSVPFEELIGDIMVSRVPGMSYKGSRVLAI